MEIEADQRNQELSELIKRQAEQIDQMKSKLNYCRVSIEEHEKTLNFSNSLTIDGFIDIDGNLINRDI